jgi:methylmalonyl-CoA mutase N-terminal domain/subunit
VSLERLLVEREHAQLDRLDQHKSMSALDRVRVHARGGQNLMPAIVDAVESYATVGEIAAALREVFGEYRESIVV